MKERLSSKLVKKKTKGRNGDLKERASFRVVCGIPFLNYSRSVAFVSFLF